MQTGVYGSGNGPNVTWRWCHIQVLRDHARGTPRESFGVRERTTAPEIWMLLGSQPSGEARSVQHPVPQKTVIGQFSSRTCPKNTHYFRSSQSGWTLWSPFYLYSVISWWEKIQDFFFFFLRNKPKQFELDESVNPVWKQYQQSDLRLSGPVLNSLA